MFRKILLFIGSMVTALLAETVVIDSLDADGILNWRGDATNGFYKVQWAASLDGDWNSDMQFANIPVNGTNYSVEVPRFFRVVWKPGHTVSGIITYSTNVMENITIRLSERTGNGFEDQYTASATNGYYQFTGLPSGSYMLTYTGTGDFSSIGRVVTISEGGLVKDLEMWKLVRLVEPSENEVLMNALQTFSWDSYPEADTHTLWFREVSEEYTFGYGPSFGHIAGITNNSYSTMLEMESGTYKWGIDSYDAFGNKIGFSALGSEFELNLP